MTRIYCLLSVLWGFRWWLYLHCICVNPLYTNGLFLLFSYNKLGIVHYTYQGCQVISFKKNIDFFLSEDLFTITNSVDPDEVPQDAAFHLGLHCL